MAISASIKQMNPAEDPRKLMLISNYNIQSMQLQKKAAGSYILSIILVCGLFRSFSTVNSQM